MHKNYQNIFEFCVTVLACVYLCSTTVQGFVNSPKIITKDGNLIFESGLNRNISIRLSGNSHITINDEYDLLNMLLISSKRRNGPTDDWINASTEEHIAQLAQQLNDFKRRTFGRRGLDTRMGQLQNRSRSITSSLRNYQTRLRDVSLKVERLTTQLEQNSCKSNPCENGGTCFNTFSGFMCKCTDKFEGQRCERDVNECALYEGTDLGCQNGAQCLNQFGTYSCVCTTGWYGVHCTQRKGDCSQASAWELCGHGTCVATNDAYGYKCLCEPGWRTNDVTLACTVDIDECSGVAHTPCSTRCVNLPGSFTCAPCSAGLTGNGVNCRDVDECATNNGGCSMSPRVACINTYGSYYCADCPVGWYGDGRVCTRSSNTGGASGGIINTDGTQNTGLMGSSCAQAASFCHPAATCVEISNTAVCSCPAGMLGSGIGPTGCIQGTANNCNALPCLNGGTCIDVGINNFTCICPIGYRSPICEPIASPCSPNPCLNGGRCRRTGGAEFVCQCSSGYHGRLCDTRFSSCGGLLSDEQGLLQYPPAGTGYEHNAQCAWVIRTNETSVLNVTFSDFDLEDSTDCRFDWLQINDGRSAASQVIGRFCGSIKPNGGQIISSTNYLYLWFRSDNSTSKEGFKLEWTSIPPQCGGVIELQSHGTIATPGSPGNYPKNRDCRWHLKAPSDRRIKLTFFTLQIEKHDDCNYDYVEITDEISDNVLYKFCNSSHPPPLLLPTSDAVVHFHSDNQGSDTGFQIHYSTEERIPGCGGVYTQREGIIKSPLYAKGDAMSCEYEIRTGIGESISIDFKSFEMEETDCLEFYDINNDNEKIFQIRYCGGLTAEKPLTFHSLYNVVQVKYYAKGGKFELSYYIDCVYTFEGSSGIITTPNYPTLSANDRYCTYKIVTKPETLISLSTLDFELKDSSFDDGDDCTATYLMINDNLDENIMGPFCSNSTPPTEFVSKSNMLILHIKTGITTSGRGFKFEYKSLPMGKENCGGIYTNPNQTIHFDVETYSEDMTCYWVIMAPGNKAILIHWSSFHLEESPDCDFDYVEVHESLPNTKNSKPLARYCGNHLPNDILVFSRVLTLKFVSDSSVNAGGFELSYDFVDLSGCGGNIHASTGRLTSPGYPQNYSTGLDCVWVLNAPITSQLELEIEMFELETSPNCNADWLEVYNGGTNQSALIGRFCGTSIPRRIPSFTNRFLLHFHTDSFISARGFRIFWRVFANGCGGIIRAENGVITSPSYPNEYPNDAQCEWRIFVHPSSVIQFTIEDFAMEHCYYDHLEIYDGRPNGYPPMIRLCSINDSTGQLQTTGNEATIVFNTDSSNTDRGFRISFTTNCTLSLTQIHGIIESINFGEFNYERPINCNWTIMAPKGNRIAIEFTHFEQSDPSAIYFIAENTTKQIQTSREATTYESTNNVLSIVHNSTSVSFRLEYKMVGCIERLHRETGAFTTPNYPKMYANNIECLWEIITKPGNAIEINISNLDIEPSINCTKDALVISNHIIESNEKERHCGQQQSLIITSSAHHLYVRFISDIDHNAKGFSATYRTLKSTCGGVMSSKNGIIQSPNYPQNYPENADCEWIITVSQHHSIIIELEELVLEDSYQCKWDYLEAAESINHEDEDEGGERQIFKLCDSIDHLSTTRWNTSWNKVNIRFISDSSNEAKGFKLHYHEACGAHVYVTETDYEYLDIKQSAIINETCIWTLEAVDVTKHIVFTPTNVMLHPSAALEYVVEGDCIEHGIKIYDGLSAKGVPRVKFCRTNPPAIISNGHALTIAMPANLIMEFMGTYMTMDTLCAGEYDSIHGKFTTPYYPNSYPVNIVCIWTIHASAGNSLSLTFESMDLESSDDCNNDFVEVREEDSRGKLLGVYCGNQLPPVIQGKQSLWINFRSNNDIVAEGFMASYNYEKHNEISGISGIIESPSYSSRLHTTEPYSWRITVDNDYVVLLTIKQIIDIDIPHIRFYDGYSDIGMGIDYANTHVVRSNTNVLYFTATRGPFKFEWQRLSKEVVRANRTAEERTKNCGKENMIVDTTLRFTSPGYPNGYANNLHCSWIFMPANPATHVVLQLNNIDVEYFSNCLTDYVKISASNDLQNWSELSKVCSKPNITNKPTIHGKPYLKLEFVTDSTINQTGFESLINTECGSDLTDRRGFVNITKLHSLRTSFFMDCVWTISVRPGRRIRIMFPDSILRSSGDKDKATSTDCKTYFMVRNGIGYDSPFLGKGKYCDNNITDVLETTTNHAYLKFKREGFRMFRASFEYEEISHDCSDEITLTEDMPFDRSSINISSPNYPYLPHPHSECVWRIIAPEHHVIAVSFEQKFDLLPGTGPLNDACDKEYVQLNDGSTELMPLIGRYCGKKKPDTVYSTGNVLRMKYFTDVAEPHIGFFAHVTLGRCGGAYYSAEGVISTPQKLRVLLHERNFECVYKIEVELGHTIHLEFEMFQLPQSANCTENAHLELQEINTVDGTEKISDTLVLCGSQLRKYIIETNKVVMRYKLLGEEPKPGDGFRVRYQSVGARCGQTIDAEHGVLQTPGYPNGVSEPTHCLWRIQVPKGGRVRVEVLDFHIGEVYARLNSFNGRITFFNDFKRQSIIGRYNTNPPSEVVSTDNRMAIDVFLLPFNRHRGSKIRFSTYGMSQCPNDLNLETNGSLSFKTSNMTSLYCGFELNIPNDQTMVLKVRKIVTDGLLLWNQYVCAVVSPLKIYLRETQLLPNFLCQNVSQPSVRFPFPINLEVYGTKRNNLDELIIDYTTYECGGSRTLYFSENMTITQPQMPVNYTGKQLECAWAIWPYELSEMEDLNNWMDDVQVEITLSVDFKGQCQDNYLLLYNGPTHNSPHLGRYCNQANAKNIVVEHGVFVEYFTSNHSASSTFNLTLNYGSGCGGKISYPYRNIYFDKQYQNNVECIWEIETTPGFHVGLSFIDRFYIESSTNCTKDYILVQEKLPNNAGWIDLQRICGRDPPIAINTTSPGMRMIFRSDNDTIAEGFQAKFERNCGGILYATSEPQLLLSPGYPQQYEAKLMCNYTIIPKEPDSQGVLIRFLDFDIEQSVGEKCMFDNVTIQTVSETGKMTESVICGVKRKHEYRGKKSVSVVMRTDYTFFAKGFKLEYSTNLCGGEVTTSGMIESPRQHTDNSYPPNSNCDWKLKAPQGSKIIIKFEQIDFEDTVGCNYDGVEVYEGLAYVEKQRLVKFCGNLTGQLPTITIPTHEGLIHSYSDERDTSLGFRALVAFVPNCDRKIYLGPTNTTYDFNQYAAGYANNLDCNYVFTTTNYAQLQLEFNSFHVEATNSCHGDYLEVRDGSGPFAEEIGRFCGHDIPAKLISSRNSIFVHFVSDKAITDIGFTAVLTSTPRICGSPSINLNGTTTIRLVSPKDEDGNYLNNLNCFWKIIADNTIHLKFDQLDIEGPNAAGKCDTDYLKIYNSDNAEQIMHGYGSDIIFNGKMSITDIPGYAAEHIYCGKGIPSEYYSESKTIYVKFYTNNAITRPGFTLTAMQAKGCYRNFTGTQGRIKIAETEDHCDIYITAPENYTLSIYFMNQIFATYDCNMEYIEIFDVHTNNSLTKVCAYTDSGKNLYSNTNELRMRIQMSSYYSLFDMTYLASRDGPGCGGEIYNTAGVITNPFYPQSIRNNSDCFWHIRVPGNTHVLLQFDEFNLGAKSTCHSDYLQIIETIDDKELVHSYCGEDQPPKYKSQGNNVTIRFHKTVNYDGIGWVLRFNSDY